MTRLNLQQASLLAASGELGPKARAALKERVTHDCDALIELERAKSRMALLSKLPKPDLTPLEQQRIASAIKNAVHDKLRQQQDEQLKKLAKNAREHHRPARHWRWIYGSLAGLSAAAAVLLIVGTIWNVNQQIELRKVEAARQAEQKLRDYLSTDSENLTDFALRRIKNQLSATETSFTATEDLSTATQRLLDQVEVFEPQVLSGPMFDDIPL